eukprot:TRINITY_DN2629_c0_g1_i3.p5 TRINITY_DN2629_c0_g1~~TRINITY_DN2629_c0_g1_i3.p5  ORF type:complete len:107 (+),score=9.78 TRINITY_DN2629_c0_g1_i3:153-473(+)
MEHTVTLENGVLMPALGFGAFKLRGQACEDVVRDVVREGIFTHIGLLFLFFIVFIIVFLFLFRPRFPSTCSALLCCFPFLDNDGALRCATTARRVETVFEEQAQGY